MTNILTVQGLRKSFAEFTLDDISFAVPEGYIMGLIGPNGSGKTTTVQLILNMLARDGGQIEVFGLDNIADEQTIKQQIGIVFDSTFFVDEWSVNDVEKAVCGFYHHWDHERFQELIRRFDLSPSKKVKELSRGMQMKLMLAYALSHDARLLILDEPTSGLDPLARSELLDILQAYIEDGKRSVLFSTHITTDLERVADFITFMNKGKLVYTGSKDDFIGSFLIVRGEQSQLDPSLRSRIMGLRSNGGGFEGLIQQSDSALFTGCVLDKASIDEIMVFSSKEV